MTKSRSAGWIGTGIVPSALLAAGLAIGWGGPASAHPVTCGETHLSGFHILTADLTCSGIGQPITFRFSAELDLDGHTITCVEATQCIRLTDGGEIHHGTVNAGGAVGVFLQGGIGNHVHDMYVTNAGIGIAVRSTSREGIIVDNTVTHSGFGIGTGHYEGSGADGNEITGNIVTHSALWGIGIKSADNLISGNTVNNNGDSGIIVFGDIIYNLAGNVVEDNTANKNAMSGVVVGSLSGPIDVTDNTTNNNTLDGINIAAGVAADLAGNVAFRNGENGIQNDGTGTCPVSGSDKNKARNNDGDNFIGCL